MAITLLCICSKISCSFKNADAQALPYSTSNLQIASSIGSTGVVEGIINGAICFEQKAHPKSPELLTMQPYIFSLSKAFSTCMVFSLGSPRSFLLWSSLPSAHKESR
eukprot:540021-Pelagomonas_calceolata.AAC.1